MFNRYQSPLLLAGAILAVAVLAILDVVPQGVAQFAPAVLLALFPHAWLDRQRACRTGC